ncbi:MAG: 50S ribosomal protein L17 [Planctomycetales bacterium]|nr:50S ribosomal protein L17 [Planctomycetales bacterium]
MRHRKRGRTLGRSSSHRKAMIRNLASSLFLTEREYEPEEDGAPKVPGRVVTTLQKAKEARSLVEKCITLARHSIPAQEEARKFETDAERNTDQWRSWRKSEQWQKWCAAIAPVVTARRRAVQLLGDKEAVQILFDEIAPRFEDRPGGYTRVVRLATPRLGDGGTQAIFEFVGVRDRVVQRSVAPSFEDDVVKAPRKPAAEETAEPGDAEKKDAE